MKKILTLSIISSILLMAGNPIHDLMDNRIKGKSYSGTLDDNAAAQDGLGILPLQHHSGTTELNNELLVQKVFNKIVKSETDNTKTVNIKNSILNGTVGTIQDTNILNQVGFNLSYQSGSLSSCKEIKTSFPTSTDGIYNIQTLGNVYCDMTTDGGGWTLVVNTWAPYYQSVHDSDLVSLGKYLTNPSINTISFKEIRYHAEKSGMILDIKRTSSVSSTNLNRNDYTSQSYLGNNNYSGGTKWTDSSNTFQYYTEFHYFNGTGVRLIFRADYTTHDIHAVSQYEYVGADTPACGMFGLVYIR